MVKCKIALFLDIVNKEMAFSVLKFGDKKFGIHQARVDAELELGAPRGVAHVLTGVPEPDFLIAELILKTGGEKSSRKTSATCGSFCFFLLCQLIASSASQR
jgi:hypothetical protein